MMTLPALVAAFGRAATCWDPTVEIWESLECASRLHFNDEFRIEVADICNRYLVRFSQSIEAVHLKSVRSRNEQLLKGLQSALKAVSTNLEPQDALDRQAWQMELWSVREDPPGPASGWDLSLQTLRVALECYIRPCSNLADRLARQQVSNAANSAASNVEFFVIAVAEAFDRQQLPIHSRRDIGDLDAPPSSFSSFVWSLWLLLPERDAKPVSQTAMNQRIADLLRSWREGRSEKNPS